MHANSNLKGPLSPQRREQWANSSLGGKNAQCTAPGTPRKSKQQHANPSCSPGMHQFRALGRRESTRLQGPDNFKPLGCPGMPCGACRAEL